MRDGLRPAGELEGLLVDRIIAAHWRLRRLGRVEAGIFALACAGKKQPKNSTKGRIAL